MCKLQIHIRFCRGERSRIDWKFKLRTFLLYNACYKIRSMFLSEGLTKVAPGAQGEEAGWTPALDTIINPRGVPNVFGLILRDESSD